jgi:hypothetical protein
LGAREATIFSKRGSPCARKIFRCQLHGKKQEEINMKDQPKKSLTYNALFIVTVSIEKGKLIEQLMNDKEKQVTGLTKLSPEELANLNAWLDVDKVFAPGGISSIEPVERN